MEFGQLMKDILVYVSCKFEMYIFKMAQVISENVRIAFLYVLSIYHGESPPKIFYITTKTIILSPGMQQWGPMTLIICSNGDLTLILTF